MTEIENLQGRGLAGPISTGPMYFAVALLVGSAATSAYHGYKRNEGRGAVGAAIGWGLLGFFFPILTPVVALAQGYAEPAA